ncbi:hypothetical protein PTSG_07745 [Salpingoeca rosetta]|uniref:Polygalacturonase n=1 Tax=Salpingoeca rosetta (strain ATCC 50818 / BSB-021) TaxID=946362 RepID=F2UHN3_SALR5|nr:uncharacterized protein PTSG_07745 [Salpingoeca rosetta]EGD76632.1 hypothetical protein PTSG_07745 [Salpingoeca rosetta]|eukprot:XP_004991546.1 hypothetical protein PTSG_07745 [Salpingoeca rosetta]
MVQWLVLVVAIVVFGGAAAHGVVGEDTAAVEVPHGCKDPRDFGAVAGDPEAWLNNTLAMHRAFNAAVASTGTVCVQGGDFTVADVYAPSNSVLFIAQQARLLSSVPNCTHALLHLEHVQNVTVEGGGTLYGNAEHYIASYSAKDNRFNPTKPDGSRPRVIFMHNATDVVLREISVLNASDWHVHIQASRRVLVDSVYIHGDSRFPNNDGIDPDSSIDVTIRNSIIDVADDGICLKSTAGMGPLANVYVHNCSIRSQSHAIKFGSNTDEDMYNVLFDHIAILDTNSGLAIQQRSNGSIYNVTWSNIGLQTRYSAPRWWGNGEPIVITSERRAGGPPVGNIHDIHFFNISAQSENGIFVSGAAHGISNITFTNVDFTVVLFGNYSSGEGPPCFAADHVYDAIPCMGTHDRRPSARDGPTCSYYCRKIAQADAFYFERTQATLKNILVTFEGVRQPWFGTCFNHDGASDVTETHVHCVS